MKHLLFIFCILTASATSAQEMVKTRSNSVRVDTVILQGLNKITARVYNLEAEIGDTIKFGNLFIEVKNCWKAPPEETPENAVLMDIKDIKSSDNGKTKRVFIGWMFSSSPAISGLEHPVYDIIPIECYDSKKR